MVGVGLLDRQESGSAGRVGDAGRVEVEHLDDRVAVGVGQRRRVVHDESLSAVDDHGAEETAFAVRRGAIGDIEDHRVAVASGPSDETALFNDPESGARRVGEDIGEGGHRGEMAEVDGYQRHLWAPRNRVQVAFGRLRWRVTLTSGAGRHSRGDRRRGGRRGDRGGGARTPCGLVGHRVGSTGADGDRNGDDRRHRPDDHPRSLTRRGSAPPGRR